MLINRVKRCLFDQLNFDLGKVFIKMAQYVKQSGKVKKEDKKRYFECAIIFCIFTL